MKKFYLTVIFCLASVAGIFAQAGYRNYTFGMTAEQVQRLAPDTAVLSEHGGGMGLIDAALMYLYNSELGSVYDYKKIPSLEYTGKYSAYYSEKEQLQFRFFDNKLYEVSLEGLDESILVDLKRRYGDKKVITIDDSGFQNVDTVTWIDGKNIIVYGKYYSGSRVYGSYVEYYNADYINPLMQKAMQKYRNSRTSRID